ncbi:hypothetical protein B0G76_1309 [Paraburkholderia sp. BL23I1N1]|uniref:hypothetical protein n=1 Tax=Paraburkholderia sp. BL23I1N1 TaxID=1938802 RepID=UPI000FEF78E8|nr:hypothetical protein [Paraburkholderia sp. BL23I1N1]RKE35248.1 hypothetical protein B0G76_1309 [Paraburkholderia sp. BL23I1N1]
MSLTSWIFLSFLVVVAAAWASVRVAAQFDALFESHSAAEADRVGSEAQSRRAVPGGQ